MAREAKVPTARFTDVAGKDEAKRDVEEIVAGRRMAHRGKAGRSVKLDDLRVTADAEAGSPLPMVMSSRRHAALWDQPSSLHRGAAGSSARASAWRGRQGGAPMAPTAWGPAAVDWFVIEAQARIWPW
jgi:hypothetical protein